jgi:hypothetical protein
VEWRITVQLPSFCGQKNDGMLHRYQDKEDEMYSLNQVSRRLGVPYYRISYAHASGAVREPDGRFAGKRIYTEADVAELAKHFDKQQPGEEPEKGDQCTSSDTTPCPRANSATCSA